MKTIIDNIKGQIISGKFQRGEYLRQEALAASFGISKIPIREALFSLAKEGYLESVPDKGIRVRKVKAHEFEELFAIRKSLQITAFEKAWKNHSYYLYDQMEYLLWQIDNIPSNNLNQYPYWMFNYLLIKDCNMNRLVEMLGVYHLLCNQIHHYIDYTNDPNESNTIFWEILATCRKKRFSVCKSLLKEHLNFPKEYNLILNSNNNSNNSNDSKKNKKMNKFQILTLNTNKSQSDVSTTEKKAKNSKAKKWRFWIDRGGTFTDIVAMSPLKDIQVMKLLSNNPRQYQDAAIEGIKRFLKLTPQQKINPRLIDSVKMGTTVATNALLERKGERTALLITQGLRDVLKIGYQNRPRLFDLNIILPELLYKQVIEVEERVDINGNVLQPLNLTKLKKQLKQIYQEGYRSIAVVYIHAYKFPEHELKTLKIAKQIGFTQISISHQISSLIKLVGRGDTTIADAYLNPILQNYVKSIAQQLGKTRLFFMQSNSGLTSAKTFQGKDAVLSGPAGGIVGMVKTSQMANITKIIGFDMGGTSTDVSHYNGEYERVFETTVSGVRLCAPMMSIHTVAAGGGSVINYDGMRFIVGPSSAGADPGPACYRNGGPLTVTDCNVMLGNINPQYFPMVFGKNFDQPIDEKIVRKKFDKLAKQTNKTPEAVAEGFLKIAIENMVNAVKKISIQRGYDITKYVLYCFGGAGGQHACAVAESLGIEKVFIHPLSSVLSAYGMGLADIIEIKSKSIEQLYNEEIIQNLKKDYQELEEQCINSLEKQGVDNYQLSKQRKIHIRYSGTNTELLINFNDFKTINQSFLEAHQQRFGFVMKGRKLMVGAISVEVKGGGETIVEPQFPNTDKSSPKPITHKKVYLDSHYQETPFFDRKDLLPGNSLQGPAIIIEENSTILVRPNWQADISNHNHLLLSQIDKKNSYQKKLTQTVDPIQLEIFNNLFMSVAEQMGEVLANTAYSVNIKERLDFSCAIFDKNANLIANAPHVPVHLGSMGDSVRAVIKKWKNDIYPGDCFILNDPYGGGTHLPDITLVTPVYLAGKITFYVASRGHHADIGGISPGSMPANSQHLDEEGVLIPNIKIVSKWQWEEQAIKKSLTKAKYPVRNYNQNIEDLKAQLAANEKGVVELIKSINQFGLKTVLNYVGFVQDNAEQSVKKIIPSLISNHFSLKMDHGAIIKVTISIDKKQKTATVDFAGTSLQSKDNFNAPLSVCRAAVLYVFRTLVKQNIPMNEGCLRPINLIVPQGCFLNPIYPGAVVAGNVETSQAIVDALYGALQTMGESQGTMNNFTFGNKEYQYYETIGGGTGAGDGFNGADAVHSHMTNSLMTDPEVLELRYPVLLKQFKVRPDSGGQGKFCGGNGIIREIEFNQTMHGSIISGHRIYPPYGMNGGEGGKTGVNQIIRKNKKIENLAHRDDFILHPGDRFHIETPGGGGYGKANKK